MLRKFFIAGTVVSGFTALMMLSITLVDAQTGDPLPNRTIRSSRIVGLISLAAMGYMIWQLRRGLS